MKHPVERMAKAVAEGVVFSVANTIWEATWLEVVQNPKHGVLMSRGILKALWYISEHLYLNAHFRKSYLLYALKQDLSLGNQRVSGASERTLRDTMKQIVDRDERQPGFGWFLEVPARTLMKGAGYTDDEMNASEKRETDKYITYRSDKARNNLSAIRQTAISVHRKVTGGQFIAWLIAELSRCELDQFDVHSYRVLNSYEEADGCRHRFAKLIRADLQKHGYRPSDDENDNMQPLKPDGTLPTNPRRSYQPDAKPEPIYFRRAGW